jgi:hypothetical protein
VSDSSTFGPAGWDDPAPGGGLDLSDLSAADVVDALADQCRGVDRAEADKLALVVHYVDLHPVTPVHPAACWDLNDGLGERELRPRAEVPLAGVGTPGVTDYALEALGPALGMGYRATKAYVAATVELRFRLPHLWDLVQAGRLQAWRALRVAEATPTLSPDAVGFVDRHVAVIAGRNRVPGPGQLRALVHEALLQCDPETAQGREEAALADRDVRFDHTASTGVSALTATLDTPDALDLQSTIDDLATTMGRLGDTDPLGVRRSRALGSLADPQRTLDLYGNPQPDPTLDHTDDARGEDASPAGRRDRDAADDGDGATDHEADPAGGAHAGNAAVDARLAGSTGEAGNRTQDAEGGDEPAHDQTLAGAAAGSAADRAARARAKFGDPRCPGWNRTTGHLYAHVSVADLIGLTRLPYPGTGPGSMGIDPAVAAGIEALARSTCDDGSGPRLGPVAVVERLGAITAQLAGIWLARFPKVSVTTVLHTDGPAARTHLVLAPDRKSGGALSTAAATTPVDAHDPPPPMRESVITRDGVCCFPGCRVDARDCDLDHLVAYVPLDEGGPPGQTSLENLACLCRRHHRLKTFTPWTYTRLADGRYRWTSPHGHLYLSVPEPKTPPRHR